MSIPSFIKENRVLVAGLALPILLILLFSVVKSIPITNPDPPRYGLIYASPTWGSAKTIVFKVDPQGKLAADVLAAQTYGGTTQPAKTALYYYDPVSNTSQTLEVTLDQNDKPTSFDKFSGLTLSTTQPSPDGYAFEPYHYNRGSLITDIFISSSYDGSPVLSKGRVIHKLPRPNPFYGNFVFVGWVTAGQVK